MRTGVKGDDNTFISPSKDPLGAVKAVAAGESADDIGSSLSYAWHEVIRAGQSGRCAFADRRRTSNLRWFFQSRQSANATGRKT